MAVYTDTVLMGMEELNLQPGDTAERTTILTGGTLNVGARSRRRRYAHHP